MSFSAPAMNTNSTSDNNTPTVMCVSTDPITYVHETHTTLSEPEDNTSSEVESFDEVDMCPAHYDDESVHDSPEWDGGPGRATLGVVRVMSGTSA